MKTLKQTLRESVICESSTKRTWPTVGGAPHVEVRKCDSIYAVEDSLELLLPGDTKTHECFVCDNVHGFDGGHLYQMFEYQYDNPETATSEDDMVSVGQYAFYVADVNDKVVFIGSDGSDILNSLEA